MSVWHNEGKVCTVQTLLRGRYPRRDSVVVLRLITGTLCPKKRAQGPTAVASANEDSHGIRWLRVGVAVARSLLISATHMPKLNKLLLGIALIVSSQSPAEAGGKNKPAPVVKDVPVAKASPLPSKKRLKVKVHTSGASFFKDEVVETARLSPDGMRIDLLDKDYKRGFVFNRGRGLKVEVDGLGEVSPLSAAVYEGVAKLTARRFNTSQDLQLDISRDTLREVQEVQLKNPTLTRSEALAYVFMQRGMLDIYGTVAKLGYDADSLRLETRRIDGGVHTQDMIVVSGKLDTRPMMERFVAGLFGATDTLQAGLRGATDTLRRKLNMSSGPDFYDE